MRPERSSTASSNIPVCGTILKRSQTRWITEEKTPIKRPLMGDWGGDQISTSQEV